MDAFESLKNRSQVSHFLSYRVICVARELQRPLSTREFCGMSQALENRLTWSRNVCTKMFLLSFAIRWDEDTLAHGHILSTS